MEVSKIKNEIGVLGEIRQNTNGTDMKIISINNKGDMDVMFLDEHQYIKKHVIYQNFKSGQIKNPYDKTIYNIGYLGEGEYKPRIKKYFTKEYIIWRAMLRRCYAESNYNASYYGICTVCSEWLNFQNFAKWYSYNYYKIDERLHLDKDIIEPGNKVYSPEKCLLIPQRLNMLFSNKPNKRGLPNGIVKVKTGYLAKYNSKEIGTYKTVDEAFCAYVIEKESAVRKIAEEYKNIIPSRAYDAIINYKVDMKNDKNIA